MSPLKSRLLTFQTVPDHRGNLAIVEGGKTLPFSISRIYYLYDVPGGAVRGGHAHRNLQEVVIAITGSFDVTLDDGRERQTMTLRRSNEGLHIPPMAWRELANFTSGAVCLVLASHPYDERDYIRDYAAFVAEVSGKHGA